MKTTMIILILAVVFLPSITHSILHPNPSGDIWQLRRNVILSYETASSECNLLGGTLTEIHSTLEMEEATDFIKTYASVPRPGHRDVVGVWLAAEKFNGSYQWTNSQTLVNFSIVMMDPEKEECEDDCCNLILHRTGMVFGNTCKGNPIRARALCTLYTASSLKNNQLQTDETLITLSNSTQFNKLNLQTVKRDKTILYILSGINVTGFVLLGILTIVIFRKIWGIRCFCSRFLK